MVRDTALESKIEYVVSGRSILRLKHPMLDVKSLKLYMALTNDAMTDN